MGGSEIGVNDGDGRERESVVVEGVARESVRQGKSEREEGN